MMEHAKIGSAAEVSVLRLYLLRVPYLLVVVGLGIQVWPGVIGPDFPFHYPLAFRV